VPDYLKELLVKEDENYTINLKQLHQDLTKDVGAIKQFFENSYITRYFKIKLLQGLSQLSSLDNISAFIFRPIGLSKMFNNFYIFIFIVFVYHCVYDPRFKMQK
jgi:hypothetical protein